MQRKRVLLRAPYEFSLTHVRLTRGLWPLSIPFDPDVVRRVITPPEDIVAPPSLNPESHIASIISGGRYPTGRVAIAVSPMFPELVAISVIFDPVLLHVIVIVVTPLTFRPTKSVTENPVDATAPATVSSSAVWSLRRSAVMRMPASLRTSTPPTSEHSSERQA